MDSLNTLSDTRRITMATQIKPDKWPQEVQEAIWCKYLMLLAPTSLQLVRKRLLSKSEQEEADRRFAKSGRTRMDAVWLWRKLRGVPTHRAVIDLSLHLGLIDAATHRWLMRETGEMSDDPDKALEIALAKADLVVSESPRALYWKGALIDIDWTVRGKLWDYVVLLSKAAKRGRSVQWDECENATRTDHLSKLKSRLASLPMGAKGKFLIPADLKKRIIPAGRGGQTLDLPPEKICVLENGVTETVREFA
jgi:hypothetical protein